jgi:hypothetical protein
MQGEREAPRKCPAILRGIKSNVKTPRILERAYTSEQPPDVADLKSYRTTEG